MRKHATNITPKQCQRARALLKWNPQDLASRTRIPVRHIEKFERNQVKLLKPENKEIIEIFAKKNVAFYSNGDVEIAHGKHNADGEIKYIQIDMEEETIVEESITPVKQPDQTTPTPPQTPNKQATATAVKP